MRWIIGQQAQVEQKTKIKIRNLWILVVRLALGFMAKELAIKIEGFYAAGQTQSSWMLFLSAMSKMIQFMAVLAENQIHWAQLARAVVLLTCYPAPQIFALSPCRFIAASGIDGLTAKKKLI